MWRTLVVMVLVGLGASAAMGQGSFVNWENPQIHPLDITPDGNRLVLAHTADNRLEVFDIATGTALKIQSIPVGVDPVSARARTETEVWVVNHISDSVSIVDLTQGTVVFTLATEDEPCDVVFAGSPERAFVSCSQSNSVLVFDPANRALPPVRIEIDGEDPRSLAVSPDGSSVYVAVFESGNATTILGGGLELVAVLAYPPNVVSHPLGPYGGQNPPPNSGDDFLPPQNPDNPSAPRVGLIVRKDDRGRWFDDNGGDWTDFVSGDLADLSGRPVGWNLLDNDVAVIDAQDLDVAYIKGLMNICMAMAVNPATGEIAVVGTDAINEVRFEPVLKGRFLRVHLAFVNPANPQNASVVDLNPHLDYTTPTVAQELRDLSLGDPRGIAFNTPGTRAYVTGKGSNNIVVLDAAGNRSGAQPTIEVGEGPSGLALDEKRGRLYVLNQFEGSISVIDTAVETEVERIAFFDPTPPAIKAGRKHLYDTHKTSGLGHIACASCHVDSRMDRLAWDLGDPAGEVKPFNQNCFYNTPGFQNCGSWHPMKGPMTTQTLQDIIGKEPLHWRGDRDGLEEFNGAFLGLQGDDEDLMAEEMQEYEDFLATIHFPPNPFRDFDNSLPTDLPLPGHFTTGRFGPAGEPFPNGNAELGLGRYRFGGLDGGIHCVQCHALPTGMGANVVVQGIGFTFVPPGPDGELHHALFGMDGSTQHGLKIPHLRNLYEKVGFETTKAENRAGFGFLHDGSVDSIARFISEPAFSVTSDQDVANLLAFMLAFSGSDLPQGSLNNPFHPPGTSSRDTHAAVGKQMTFDGANNTSPEVTEFISAAHILADQGAVGLVAKGMRDGILRGYAYLGGGLYQADRAAEQVSAALLQLSVAVGEPLTMTVVPAGSEIRIGIDRDEDGFFDRDEADGCSDPADPRSVPPNCVEFVRGDCDDDGAIMLADPLFSLNSIFAGGSQPGCLASCDLDADGKHALGDALYSLNYQFLNGPQPAAPFPGCGVDPTDGGLACGGFGQCF